MGLLLHNPFDDGLSRLFEYSNAEEHDGDEAAESHFSGKIGAKKQRKLEEKQARKAQREVSIPPKLLAAFERKVAQAKDAAG